ncbi:Nn.00g013130.m01.CDS01 [Neocucurbitaria sp. VM-36]
MAPSNTKQPFLAKETPSRDDDHSREEARPRPNDRFIHRWRSSWQAPTTMIGLLFLGGALALGHHFFYRSLRGTRVPDSYSQQLNTAYGTAFAFLAKASLIGAISAAYIQHIWFDFRTKFAKISTIDSKFMALSSILSLLDPQFLLKSKVGAILALLTWLLPLAAIVTPATLSVRTTQTLDVATLHVPNADFPSAFPVPAAGNALKPSLDRLARFVTSGIQIPPVDAYIPNATYTLDFVGPSLQCGTPSDDVLRNIDTVFDTVNNKTGSQPNAVYVAFSPFTPVTYSGRAWPLDDPGQSSDNPDDWKDFVDLCLTSSNRVCSFIEPTLYGRPDDSTAGWGETIDTTNALWLRLGDERLACSIQKTQYSVDFDARNSLTALKSYSFIHQGTFEANSNETAGFIVATQPLLNILSGATWYSARWCSTAEMQMSKCTTDISYRTSRTAIHETALTAMIYTKANEIFQKLWDIGSKAYAGAGQVVDSQSPPPAVDDLDLRLSRNLTIGTIIEEMSRNMTLSYFTDARYLLYNSTSVQVTTTSTYNIYAYNVRNLILAYVIAFGASLLAVLAGMYVYLANGRVNCTATFSSILCATVRNPGLASLVEQAAPLIRVQKKSESLLAGRELLNLRLKYGRLVEEHGVDGESRGFVEDGRHKHVEAFGAPDQVL